MGVEPTTATLTTGDSMEKHWFFCCFLSGLYGLTLKSAKKSAKMDSGGRIFQGPSGGPNHGPAVSNVVDRQDSNLDEGV
jgi:hypothetical protein